MKKTDKNCLKDIGQNRKINTFILRKTQPRFKIPINRTNSEVPIKAERKKNISKMCEAEEVTNIYVTFSEVEED